MVKIPEVKSKFRNIINVSFSIPNNRFRSITKNYFRRADGVIVMFDVTSERSFMNVKGWMLNVEVYKI